MAFIQMLIPPLNGFKKRSFIREQIISSLEQVIGYKRTDNGIVIVV